MTNTGPDRLREYKRLALSLAVALGLSALAFLVSPESASADHVCQLNPGGSPSIQEGSSVTLTGDILFPLTCDSYAWDLDNDGAYDDGSGRTINFAAGDRDGPSLHIVGIRGITQIQVCERDPESGGQICHFENDYDYAQIQVSILNAPPTATFDVPTTPVTTGEPFSLWLFTPLDPSLADRNAGFQNYFDCEGDGSFVLAVGVTNGKLCTANNGLSQTVRGKIYDKDEGFTTYTGTVTLNDTTKPTVLNDSGSLEPDRGEVGVSLTTSVSVTFSEEMKPDSLTSTTFKLQQYNRKTGTWKTIPATMASITVDNGKTTATLDPFGATEGSSETPLAANKKFRGLVTTGSEDLAGNPLASKFIWTFKTGG